MKKNILLTALAFIILSASAVTAEKLRIGVYDSRMIAVWHFNSSEYQKEMQDMRTSYDKAKQDKDYDKIKELEEKGPLTQRILHDKGFGRGSTATIIEKKRDELETLVKNENLVAVVSKWELNYSNPDIEIVDVTLNLLGILKAPEHLIKMYDEMKKQPPVEDAFFLDPAK